MPDPIRAEYLSETGQHVFEKPELRRLLSGNRDYSSKGYNSHQEDAEFRRLKEELEGW